MPPLRWSACSTEPKAAMAARTKVTCIDIGLLVREHVAGLHPEADADPDVPMMDCCRGKWLLVTSVSEVEVLHVPQTLH
jgi:hypothetical protein